MRFKTAISNNRRRKSGGQAIVENALTLIPMLTMILGITDFGLMIFRWTTLQNAVREGTRYAVTFQVDTSGTQDKSIENQVTAYGFGLVKTSDSPQTIFVKYYNPTTFAQVTTNGNQPGNVVQVSVQGVKFSWISILNGTWWSVHSNSPLTLNVFASDVLGGFPVGTTSVPE
jgi:Flp pilus assembly protein TadG